MAAIAFTVIAIRLPIAVIVNTVVADFGRFGVDVRVAVVAIILHTGLRLASGWQHEETIAIAIVVTRVPDPIPVHIGLIGVRDALAVVRIVTHSVAIGIAIRTTVGDRRICTIAVHAGVGCARFIVVAVGIARTRASRSVVLTNPFDAEVGRASVPVVAVDGIDAGTGRGIVLAGTTGTTVHRAIDPVVAIDRGARARAPTARIIFRTGVEVVARIRVVRVLTGPAHAGVVRAEVAVITVGICCA